MPRIFAATHPIIVLQDGQADEHRLHSAQIAFPIGLCRDSASFVVFNFPDTGLARRPSANPVCGLGNKVNYSACKNRGERRPPHIFRWQKWRFYLNPPVQCPAGYVMTGDLRNTASEMVVDEDERRCLLLPFWLNSGT